VARRRGAEGGRVGFSSGGAGQRGRRGERQRAVSTRVTDRNVPAEPEAGAVFSQPALLSAPSVVIRPVGQEPQASSPGSLMLTPVPPGLC
jgi:hypothetical protein